MRIEVFPEVPRSMGLGGSAAMAVAIVRALDKHFSCASPTTQVNSLAFESEKVAHGSPSGLDNTLACYGKALVFRPGDPPLVEPLNIREPIPAVIGMTGLEGLTAKTVGRVREAWQQDNKLYERIFDQIDALTLRGIQAIQDNDLPTLGELMNICQGMLNALQVSTPELEKLVRHRARERRARREADGRWRRRLDHRDLRRRHGARRQRDSRSRLPGDARACSEPISMAREESRLQRERAADSRRRPRSRDRLQVEGRLPRGQRACCTARSRSSCSTATTSCCCSSAARSEDAVAELLVEHLLLASAPRRGHGRSRHAAPRAGARVRPARSSTSTSSSTAPSSARSAPSTSCARSTSAATTGRSTSTSTKSPPGDSSVSTALEHELAARARDVHAVVQDGVGAHQGQLPRRYAGEHRHGRLSQCNNLEFDDYPAGSDAIALRATSSSRSSRATSAIRSC